MQALVFVGDAMEDLPTFTPASLACRYFCFRKGTIERRPELGVALGNCCQHLPPMPEWEANVLEVLIGQMGQY